MHTFMTGRKSTKFQVNPMKDIGGGVAETRSLERTEGRTDGITHTRTDEGHFYNPLLPTSDDKEKEINEMRWL